MGRSREHRRLLRLGPLGIRRQKLYNAVKLTKGKGSVRVLAFNGARYETVFNGEASDHVRFPTVTGSNQLKVLGKMESVPGVFLLPDETE